MTQPYRLFVTACTRGELEEAKQIYYSNKITIRCDSNIFTLACCSGNIELARWIYSFSTYIWRVDMNAAFVETCSKGHMDIAHWIHSSITKRDIENVTIFSSKSCHAQFLSTPRLDEQLDYNAAFIFACENGHMKLAVWIHSHLRSLNKICTLAKNSAFKLACQNGYLTIAKWIYSLGNIDINANDDEPFKLACQNNHLNVAKWIYSFRGINIYVENNFILRQACYKNHLNLAKWIYSLDKNNVRIGNLTIIMNDEQNLSRILCMCYAKIYSLYETYFNIRSAPYDMHSNDNQMFVDACIRGYADVAELVNSFGKVSQETYSECFMYIKTNDIVMLQFLLENVDGVYAKNVALIKRIDAWENKLEACRVLLSYCSEEDYYLFDTDIVRRLTSRTKSARTK